MEFALHKIRQFLSLNFKLPKRLIWSLNFFLWYLLCNHLRGYSIEAKENTTLEKWHFVSFQVWNIQESIDNSRWEVKFEHWLVHFRSLWLDSEFAPSFEWNFGGSFLEWNSEHNNDHVCFRCFEPFGRKKTIWMQFRQFELWTLPGLKILIFKTHMMSHMGQMIWPRSGPYCQEPWSTWPGQEVLHWILIFISSSPLGWKRKILSKL